MVRIDRFPLGVARAVVRRPRLECFWVPAADGRGLEARWREVAEPWFLPARRPEPRRSEPTRAPRRSTGALHPLLRVAAA
ncbi:MAG: hypothetical protein NZM40_01065 [Sphingomonadaceae bacterium]|uniref:hypothetical protein n=1 Tax=Thermaurantiacus sp. TaxID=2820283 RepID=UPI00298EFE2E|nr:hypothetical protein [Thermaurantiacus sp.]MCS6986032.1 hypothetical protein [Sphingomonadaceae bacterium]MDW8414752.1 hypothetical protein [Thermaurantiacus sp.]